MPLSSALIRRRVASSAACSPSRRALTIGVRRAASTSTSFAIFVSQARSSVLAPFVSRLVPQVETSRIRSIMIYLASWSGIGSHRNRELDETVHSNSSFLELLEEHGSSFEALLGVFSRGPGVVDFVAR